MSETEHRVEDGALEQDDAIIGKAFRWSLLAILLIAGLVAALIFSSRGSDESAVVVETETQAPEQLATTGDRAPAAVTFTDVTDDWGIGFRHNNGAYGERLLPETMGSGVAVFDFDNDGDMDLFFVNSRDWPWRQEQRDSAFALYRNDGRGMFVDVSAAANVPEGVYGMGVAAGDFDADGYTDLLLTAVGENLLLKNVDGQRFEEVASQAGVQGAGNAWSTGAAFFDADRDDDLDLYVSNYVEWSRDIDLEVDYQLTGIGRAFGPPANYAGTQDYFYLNNGDGTFADHSEWVEVFNPSTGQAVGQRACCITRRYR